MACRTMFSIRRHGTISLAKGSRQYRPTANPPASAVGPLWVKFGPNCYFLTEVRNSSISGRYFPTLQEAALAPIF
jgi:hypothetical protein